MPRAVVGWHRASLLPSHQPLSLSAMYFWPRLLKSSPACCPGNRYVLQDCRFSLWESQYFLAPAAAVCLVATGLWYEGGVLLATGDLVLLGGAPWAVAGAASLGLGVQLLTAAVVQGPGAVTLKVLSQARNAGLVLVGVVFYGESVSPTQGAGYATSLAAFAAYNVLHARDGAAAAAAAAASGAGGGGGPGSTAPSSFTFGGRGLGGKEKVTPRAADADHSPRGSDRDGGAPAGPDDGAFESTAAMRREALGSAPGGLGSAGGGAATVRANKRDAI